MKFFCILGVFVLTAAFALGSPPVFGKETVKETDSNGDGKPDVVKTFLKGRQLVLIETDRDFDGKVDRRKLSEWGMRNLVPGEAPIPGYQNVWVEEDNNYDGKIDAYREKGNKDAAKKIGQPIDTNFHRSAS